MALVTLCPQCSAQYKIVPDQLRLHNGMVRCGGCTHIFDASKSLKVVSDAPAPPPPEPPPLEWTNKAVVQALVNPGFVPPPPADTQFLPTKSTVSANEDLKKTLFEQIDTEDKPRGLGLLWGMMIGVLSFIAALQLSLMYRYALHDAWPASKPALSLLCKAFGCELEPAAYLSALNLEHLVLKRVQEPTGNGQLAAYELQATIRNTSKLHVLAPQLELSLSNAQSQTIARKVLTLKELGWSGAGVSIAPLSDWVISRPLELNPLTAGFTGRLVPADAAAQ